MNHVPDAVLARLDTLGRSVLAGDAVRIRAGLRTDLRLAVDYDGCREPFAVRFHHAADPESAIRNHGSWLATYVDGVDRRLDAWGLRTPDAYRLATDADGPVADQGVQDPAAWHTYRGTVVVPG